MFEVLLASVGFDVTLVSSGVWLPDGSLSPPFDHAALIVHLDDDWLVDVGYGGAFQIPHWLGEQWHEPGRRLRTVPRRLEEFAARCRWHETAPDNVFRQGPLVSRAALDGRVTLTGRRLVVTAHGQRTERQLPDDATLHHALRAHFDAEVASAFARLPG